VGRAVGVTGAMGVRVGAVEGVAGVLSGDRGGVGSDPGAGRGRTEGGLRSREGDDGVVSFQLPGRAVAA
jgi:hypothetical protein